MTTATLPISTESQPSARDDLRTLVRLVLYCCFQRRQLIPAEIVAIWPCVDDALYGDDDASWIAVTYERFKIVVAGSLLGEQVWVADLLALLGEPAYEEMKAC